jgi:hypothetical protein
MGTAVTLCQIKFGEIILRTLLNLKGRDHLEDLVVDGKVILECTLGKYSGNVWLNSSGSG